MSLECPPVSVLFTVELGSVSDGEAEEAKQERPTAHIGRSL